MNMGELKPRRVWGALGGNLGDVPAMLQRALDGLAMLPETEVTAVSRLYRTPPAGPVLDQPPFFNAAFELRCALELEELMRWCLQIERMLGRDREVPQGPRTVDIDLIAAEDFTCATDELTLPHPRAHERGFVLVPLCEIAPEVPLDYQSAAEWLKLLDVSAIELADALLQRPNAALR